MWRSFRARSTRFQVITWLILGFVVLMVVSGAAGSSNHRKHVVLSSHTRAARPAPAPTTTTVPGYQPTAAVEGSPAAAKQTACRFWSTATPTLLGAAGRRDNASLVSAVGRNGDYANATEAAVYAPDAFATDLTAVRRTVQAGTGNAASFAADLSAIALVSHDCTLPVAAPAPAPTTVPVTAPPSTTAPAPTTTAAPPATDPATTDPAVTAPAVAAGPTPPITSDEGTDYRAGEFCRDTDHNQQTTDASGNPLVCVNKNGWRWEHP